MSKPMRRLEYRGKKMEYIKKDALSHILAKMVRWNITVNDLVNAYQNMMKGYTNEQAEKNHH